MIIKSYSKKGKNNKDGIEYLITCDNFFCKKQFTRWAYQMNKGGKKHYCCRSCQVTGKNLDKGNNSTHIGGYKVIFVGHDHETAKQGRILEHRYIMEKYLGRYLTAEESVHHKNGNRLDNRIENLELWSRYQPSGQRVRDKIKWAKEIIKLYGTDEVKY